MPPDSEIRQALRAILDSPEFDGAERLQSFLSYVVEKYLMGQADDIRAKSIAEDVYGRSLDAGSDPMAVVRVDAGRMRRRLANYYTNSGKLQHLRIHVDPGGYVPRFELLETERDDAQNVLRLRYVFPGAMVLAALTIGGMAYFKAPDVPQDGDVQLGNTLKQQAVREALFSTNPTKLQALNLASEARPLMFPVLDRERLRAVRGMFERAIELDETYFGGFAGSAQATSILAITVPPGDEKGDLLKLARARADRAVELAPDEGWSHSALALVSFAHREFDAALAQSARATSLGPDDIHVTNFDALFALFGGEFERAITSANRAQGIDPNNRRFPYRSVLASASFHLGNYQESVDRFNEAIRLGDPVSAISIGYLAAGYQQLGDYEQARATMLLLDEAWPNYPLDTLFRALFSDKSHADEILKSLNEIPSERSGE
ncbi:tetratricopeptide repeat protein [Ruegeria sp.]|uniref:tetratricopeptide repeat protein n=1 Tax=Ruegeria sp. TaxID=1879320 RepID=UPI003C7D8674